MSPKYDKYKSIYEEALCRKTVLEILVYAETRILVI